MSGVGGMGIELEPGLKTTETFLISARGHHPLDPVGPISSVEHRRNYSDLLRMGFTPHGSRSDSDCLLPDC